MTQDRKGWEVAVEVVGAAYSRISSMLKDKRVELGEVVTLTTGLGGDLINALGASQVVVLKGYQDRPVHLGKFYAWISEDVVAKGLQVLEVSGVLLGRVK